MTGKATWEKVSVWSIETLSFLANRDAFFKTKSGKRFQILPESRLQLVQGGVKLDGFLFAKSPEFANQSCSVVAYMLPEAKNQQTPEHIRALKIKQQTLRINYLKQNYEAAKREGDSLKAKLNHIEKKVEGNLDQQCRIATDINEAKIIRKVLEDEVF